MYNTALKTLIIFFLIPLFSFAQEGIVTGVLTTEVDGLPLPGASIIVKGTSNGVTTDFDGNYSISCLVGDVLVVNYIGMTPREIKVTASMFGAKNTVFVTRIPIKPINTDAYASAVNGIKKNEFKIPNIEDSKYSYNTKNNYNSLLRIKAIAIEPNAVNLTYFDPDIYFEIALNSTLGFQFVKDNNLPDLQTKFSQGAAQNGELTFLGPETGNYFSYGPELTHLEFDGSDYNFDANGQLVALGNGNGQKAKSYNNSVFNTTINRSQNFNLNVESENWRTNLNYTNKNSEDIFGRERYKTDEVMLSFKTTKYKTGQLNWDTFVKYGKRNNNQPNINGFTNNLLLNSWITPKSFSNSQGSLLPDHTQRSFSPLNYNNPEWLFNHHKNYDANDLFVVSLQNEIEPSDDFKIRSHINYKITKNEQSFGAVANTVGFENGYLSQKQINRNTFNATLILDYETDLGELNLNLNSGTTYSHQNLKYQFIESEGFSDFSFSNPNNTTEVNNSLYQHILRLKQFVEFSYSHGSKLSISIDSYVSSIQGNKWFLPTSILSIDVLDLINIYDFRYINLSASSAFDVGGLPLFYTNQSQNSLRISPSESLTYTSNADLFTNESIDLENKHDYAFNAQIGFYALGINWDFEASYFGSQTEGSVFPILENDNFALKNIADISNKGFEFNLEFYKYFDDIKWIPRLRFFTNNTKVDELYHTDSRVPIAGFNSVSKNLIVGQPAGVIVGTAYQRDQQNNIVIDANGYPIVAAEQQIIGDPTPDFTLGFSNTFNYKKLKLNLAFNYQKGGDVWNGTQNVLNYFGTSQQSADQRSITNYVFNGVTEQGTPNTTSVDFYNAASGIENNRFVRYGFDGVAETAIEDASFFNIKTIEISYDFAQEYDAFFRQFEIGLYATNLFTITKYKGATPFSTLFDTNSGNNLNFFNTPIISEVGFRAKLKI
ncbi:carboxypeptidase-like regulatory domain-containing protein [Winogradskyella eckloniae]|uniref:carboxypeptidase-like regulatory domain-containing protein n=1 Tax=Winogradskyella eckloniae TaxID=1089306 RepID=UPI00156552EF|nr:carboxypeptidase-like regulatory domain-containing protein [Winogradskyella eckloniae]NRD18700.1 carboxypeptidase-like regulatory domain-containing protein [Winogradskyella eckloniae]